jgi:hypothetical protein
MKKLLFTAMIITGLAAGTFAQDGASATATATASATIVAPIAISITTHMDFGNVAVHAVTDGTVVLGTDGARTVTGGITLPATTGTVTAASFAVTGSGTYTYNITSPTANVTLTDPVTEETMILSTFVRDPSGTGALTDGAQTINIGATLNVAGGQAAGTYANATAIPVVVVYN